MRESICVGALEMVRMVCWLAVDCLGGSWVWLAGFGLRPECVVM